MSGSDAAVLCKHIVLLKVILDTPTLDRCLVRNYSSGFIFLDVILISLTLKSSSNTRHDAATTLVSLLCRVY